MRSVENEECGKCRVCSLELQKTIVRCSDENVRIHHVFKDYRLVFNIVH